MTKEEWDEMAAYFRALAEAQDEIRRREIDSQIRKFIIESDPNSKPGL